jgi:hypothetical protein
MISLPLAADLPRNSGSYHADRDIKLQRGFGQRPLPSTPRLSPLRLVRLGSGNEGFDAGPHRGPALCVCLAMNLCLPRRPPAGFRECRPWLPEGHAYGTPLLRLAGRGGA